MDKKINVNHIQQRIQQAAEKLKRPADSITLVAVSKTKPIDDIAAAYKMGIRHFGENRTQEFAEKVNKLSHLDNLQWHFIGQLQTRQSHLVAEYAHYFHAIDRIKIAKRLSKQLQKYQRELSIFIQINVSGEESKSGFDGSDWEHNFSQRETLENAILQISTLDNIHVCGLMTMAPWGAPKDTVHNIFQRLQKLSVWINDRHPTLQARELSMGMSDDFEIAIEEGATCVRVGSAIFGKREIEQIKR